MTYNHKVPRVIEHQGTQVINAYERYTLEFPDRVYPLKDHCQVIYKTRVKKEDDLDNLLKR